MDALRRSRLKGRTRVSAGFSHPNVAFSREHRTIDEGGHITFRFDREAIEKAVRMALLSFADGVKHWVCYFDSDQVRAFERLDDIADRLDTACDTTPPS